MSKEGEQIVLRIPIKTIHTLAARGEFKLVEDLCSNVIKHLVECCAGYELERTTPVKNVMKIRSTSKWKNLIEGYKYQFNFKKFK